MSGWLGVLLLAATARAEPMLLRYDATWAGLPAGEIHFLFDDAAGGYRSAIQIETRGLPRLLTRFRATGSSSGRLPVSGAPWPEAYDASYDLRRRHKVVALRYASSGLGQLAYRATGDTSTHPELPELSRRNTIDPIAVMAEMRRLAARGIQPGESFLIAAYDGKRRFDVEGRRDPQADAGTIRLKLVLRPLAGFRNPKADEEDPEDTPRPAELVLSDDARLVPLRATVPIVYLPLTITLAADCASAQCPVKLP